MEREFKRRSAGFRTHILICLGAAMTTLTSEFWLVYMRYYLDAARLGAGVVAGMGFIGAGTIIVTRRQRVKGLTTAAGLWTVAVVGLAIGAGFYEGGVLTTVLILLAEMLFSKLEYHIMATAPEINLSSSMRIAPRSTVYSSSTATGRSRFPTWRSPVSPAVRGTMPPARSLRCA